MAGGHLDLLTFSQPHNLGIDVVFPLSPSLPVLFPKSSGREWPKFA